MGAVKDRTVLYVPKLELVGGGKEAAFATDKDAIQQLEATVVHWNRQIKVVLSRHASAFAEESAGPLDEIKFWTRACDELSGLLSEVQRPEVQHVVELLRVTESNYVVTLEGLSRTIAEQSVEAQDNIRFLATLTEPCEAMLKATPPELSVMLPALLLKLRAIWSVSRFYNTGERLGGLLRKISNQVIRVCAAHVDVSQVFSGDVDSALARLTECIACGQSWRAAYRTMKALIERGAGPPSPPNAVQRPRRVWDLDEVRGERRKAAERCRATSLFLQASPTLTNPAHRRRSSPKSTPTCSGAAS